MAVRAEIRVKEFIIWAILLIINILGLGIANNEKWVQCCLLVWAIIFLMYTFSVKFCNEISKNSENSVLVFGFCLLLCVLMSFSAYHSEVLKNNETVKVEKNRETFCALEENGRSRDAGNTKGINERWFPIALLLLSCLAFFVVFPIAMFTLLICKFIKNYIVKEKKEEELNVIEMLIEEKMQGEGILSGILIVQLFVVFGIMWINFQQRFATEAYYWVYWNAVVGITLSGLFSTLPLAWREKKINAFMKEKYRRINEALKRESTEQVIRRSKRIERIRHYDYQFNLEKMNEDPDYSSFLQRAIVVVGVVFMIFTNLGLTDKVKEELFVFIPDFGFWIGMALSSFSISVHVFLACVILWRIKGERGRKALLYRCCKRYYEDLLQKTSAGNN